MHQALVVRPELEAPAMRVRERRCAVDAWLLAATEDAELEQARRVLA